MRDVWLGVAGAPSGVREQYLPYFLCIDNNLALHSYNEGKGTIYQTAFAVHLPLIYPSLFMKSIFTVEIRLL